MWEDWSIPCSDPGWWCLVAPGCWKCRRRTYSQISKLLFAFVSRYILCEILTSPFGTLALVWLQFTLSIWIQEATRDRSSRWAFSTDIFSRVILTVRSQCRKFGLIFSVLSPRRIRCYSRSPLWHEANALHREILNQILYCQNFVVHFQLRTRRCVIVQIFLLDLQAAAAALCKDLSLQQ
jgi:hypothetical protein